MKKPSMGRVVIYKHRGSADGEYDPIESPAIVQEVYDNGDDPIKCDLFVMSNTGGIFFAKNVLEGDNAPGTWSWPKIV